jgi:hypothetical protein
MVSIFVASPSPFAHRQITWLKNRRRILTFRAKAFRRNFPKKISYFSGSCIATNESFVKGIWQYKLSLSYLKEHLK